MNVLLPTKGPGFWEVHDELESLGNVYNVSGLDTEQTPASIEWIITSSAFTPAGGLAGNYQVTNGNNCLPYLICAYNSHLEIGAGLVINLIPHYPMQHIMLSWNL